MNSVEAIICCIFLAMGLADIGSDSVDYDRKFCADNSSTVEKYLECKKEIKMPKNR